ncbi:hypothetical protein IAU59_006518 [Kwoniella sp. CBS 9459]
MFALTKFQLLFLLVALIALVCASAAPVDNDAPWGVTPRNHRSSRTNKRAKMSNAERLRLGLPLKKPVIWGADGHQVKL